MSGLVDYSDSESENESAVAAPPPSKATAAQTTTTKKPFQKLVDRANPGRILVNLPAASADDGRPTGDEQPQAKRARTQGSGASRFSGFMSALPPPKKHAPSNPSASSMSGASSLPFSFKTSAEAAFSREPVASSRSTAFDDDEEEGAPPSRNSGGGGGFKMNLPPPKSQQQPQAGTESTGLPPPPLNGMKPDEDVVLKGKPLMFRPLSVARKPIKKATGAARPGGVKPARGGAGANSAGSAVSAGNTGANTSADSVSAASAPVEQKKQKKAPLFSLGEEATSGAGPEDSGGHYEPLFEEANAWPEENAVTSDYNEYAQMQEYEDEAPPDAYPSRGGGGGGDAQSLNNIADDLNLSKAARRELFGRGGTAAAQQAMASKVVNFSIDREYDLNEELRASGQLSAPARPVKGIAPGKHNLKQLVNAVQSQRDALEDSFAKNRSNQREAAGRYGWK